MKIFKKSKTDEIAAFLSGSNILAVPTETVFGLAVKYDDSAAVQKLVELKQRDIHSGKIFALMIEKTDEISRFSIINKKASEVIVKYLPGELTIVLPKKADFKNGYFDSFETIGFRVPDDDFLRELLQKTGPLIMTSANFKGEEPAKNIEEAMRLPIDGVVDGEVGGHAPTTVVFVDDFVRVLRQGGLRVTN